jgi:peptide/nickel transport system substrate-binding protein
MSARRRKLGRRGIAALGGAILALAFAGLASAQSPEPSAPASSGGGQPGPAADHVTFQSVFVDTAPLEIQAGNIDLYVYGLRTEAAQQLETDPTVQSFQAPATALSLVLNPAPAPEGRLNPFAIPEIRTAMEYLVDRDHITQDIYRGLAQPMITHVAPTELDFQTVYDIDRGSDIRYDPDYAHQQIDAAMTAAGAEKVGDRWQYQGQPVRVKIIARVEDERREVGDLVKSALEDAGFEVAITYQQFAAAIQTVYSTDPAAFEWQVYTEGWSRGAAQRYDDSTINSMAAPWMGNMPGWQEQGFWQYEDPEMDEMGKRLFRGQFASEDERNDLLRQMTQRSLVAPVRVWLASVLNTFPAGADLTDATLDVSSGPRSPWTLRSAHVPGSDTVRVGDLWVWTQSTTWNPVGGFGDAYSTDIWRNLYDPPLANHPFTGVPGPFRASYEVTTAGPDGTLDVPADAVVWDAANDAWVPVAGGTTARSLVTFDYSKYLGTHWHDGQTITLADAIYPIAQGFDLAYDEDKAKIETALAVTARPYLETFKGFRLTPDDKLEVYVDYWHFDEGQIAAYASPTGFGMPWEVLAAMDKLVFEERRAAYSDTAAARYSVPWLSLVMRSDANLVDRSLRQMEGSIPAGVFQFGDRSLVTQEEADARYQAARDWHDEHDHLVISQGPYELTRFDAPAQFAQLDAFRDPAYPFTASDFTLGPPPQLTIEPPEDTLIGAGQAAAIPVTVTGDGTLALRYLLLDPSTGAVVQQGPADAGTAPGSFVVNVPADVTAQMFPGLYRLSLAASSDATALITERTVDVEVTP